MHLPLSVVMPRIVMGSNFISTTSNCDQVSLKLHSTATVCPFSPAAMNWTGGRLQRGQKNSGNSALNRQKQHFAKIRQGLQDGQTYTHIMAPSRQSVLVHDRSSLAIGIPPSGHDTQHQVGRSGKGQRQLKEYHTTAPLARRRASIKKLSAIGDRSKEENDVATEMGPKQDESWTPRKQSPTHLKVHTQRSSSTYRKRRVQLSIEVEPLDTIRKRLLQQSDWVGLAPSCPLQMLFSSRHDKEKVGKRRKIDCEIEGRRAAFHGEALFEGGHRNILQTTEPFESMKLGNIQENISVRLGDDALESEMGEPSNKADGLQSQLDLGKLRQSSEIMLFDVEQSSSVHDVCYDLEREGRPREVDERSRERGAKAVHCFSTAASMIQQPSLAQQCESKMDDVSLKEGIGRNSSLDVNGGDEIEQILRRIHAVDRSHDPRGVVKATNVSQSAHHQNNTKPVRLMFDSSPAGNPTQQLMIPTRMARSPSLRGSPDSVIPRVQRFSRLPHPEMISDSNKSKAVHLRCSDESMWRQFLSVPGYVSKTSTSDTSCGYASNHMMVPSEQISLIAHQATVVDQRVGQRGFNLGASTRVTQSPSSSLRNIVTLSETPLVRQATTSESGNVDEEDLWRKFVFGDEKESTPLSEPHDQNITQPFENITLCPPTTFLHPVSSVSSHSNVGDLSGEIAVDKDQHDPLGSVSKPEKRADHFHLELKKISVRDTYASPDAHQSGRRDANSPKDRTEANSPPHSSMYNNVTLSGQTSSGD
jgi:hypothetical protein